jgi:hypothetical protein
VLSLTHARNWIEEEEREHKPSVLSAAELEVQLASASHKYMSNYKYMRD